MRVSHLTGRPAGERAGGGGGAPGTASHLPGTQSAARPASHLLAGRCAAGAEADEPPPPWVPAPPGPARPGPAAAGASGARPHLAGGGGRPHHGEEAAEREGEEGGEAPDEEQGGDQHLAAAEGGVAQPGDAEDALQADGRQREDDDGAAQAHHIEEQVADDVAQLPGLGPAHDGDEGHGCDEEQVGAEEVEDEAVGGEEPALPPHQQADAPDVSSQRQQEDEAQGR